MSQQRYGLFNGRLQCAEFIVYCDAERLERSGRRVDALARAPAR